MTSKKELVYMYMYGWFTLLYTCNTTLSVSNTPIKFIYKKMYLGVPIMAQWKQIRLETVRLRVPSLALDSGLRILPCHELWCRWQMWLGSHVVMAVVLAGSCSCNWTPSLGNSIYLRCGPKKWKKKIL